MIKNNPAFIYKAKQVAIITVIWIIAGVLLELNNAISYDPVTRRYFTSFIFGRTAIEHLLITAIGPLFGGLLCGSFIVFYQRGKLKGSTYLNKLLIHSGLYIFFVSLSILGTGLIGALFTPTAQGFLKSFYEDISSLRVLRLLVNWYFIVILTIFLLDVSEKYGSGTLKKLLLGKYHSPGKEERIFMFLDLRSSTAIAEKIGDEQYFKMLRFFYEMANEVIINHHGEIYQYVGDEIVISWEKGKGLRKADCLHCFFAVRQAVKDKADHFTENFFVVPEFKAGVHCGEVTTGEIGTVKKDIVYSGDVLNTTARITALCNKYNETLLISETLYRELKDTAAYRFTYIDNPLLRGKQDPFAIYAVKPL